MIAPFSLDYHFHLTVPLTPTLTIFLLYSHTCIILDAFAYALAASGSNPCHFILYNLKGRSLAGITVLGAAKWSLARGSALLRLRLDISYLLVLFLFIVHKFTSVPLIITKISPGNAWVVAYVICLVLLILILLVLPDNTSMHLISCSFDIL